MQQPNRHQRSGQVHLNPDINAIQVGVYVECLHTFVNKIERGI